MLDDVIDSPTDEISARKLEKISEKSFDDANYEEIVFTILGIVESPFGKTGKLYRV